jgi:hypothetical protein
MFRAILVILLVALASPAHAMKVRTFQDQVIGYMKQVKSGMEYNEKCREDRLKPGHRYRSRRSGYEPRKDACFVARSIYESVSGTSAYTQRIVDALPPEQFEKLVAYHKDYTAKCVAKLKPDQPPSIVPNHLFEE